MVAVDAERILVVVDVAHVSLLRHSIEASPRFDLALSVHGDDGVDLDRLRLRLIPSPPLGEAVAAGMVAPVALDGRLEDLGVDRRTGARNLVIHDLAAGLWTLCCSAEGAVITTRIVSVGSLVACWSLPVVAWATGRPIPLAAALAVVAALVTIRHAPNLRRLVSGEEPKVAQRTATESGAES